MTQNLLKYKSFELLDIEASSPEELAGVCTSNIRVSLPAHPDNILKMEQMGFCLGDRTIGAVINLERSNFDYNRFIRFDIQKNNECKERVLEIACESFDMDRRFHVKPQLDSAIAAEVLEAWVNELTCTYVCEHKGRIVGFLDVEPVGPDAQFIHLAAVEPKYRAVGAAMSLYAFAFKKARESGVKKLMGRVSSRNTPALNLYAMMGATFEKPIDVFLKEG